MRARTQELKSVLEEGKAAKAAKVAMCETLAALAALLVSNARVAA
jgi:hypothetical protein